VREAAAAALRAAAAGMVAAHFELLPLDKAEAGIGRPVVAPGVRWVERFEQVGEFPVLG
jgi:hypothetical protein